MHQSEFRYQNTDVAISGPIGDWITECISRTGTFYEREMLEAIAALNIKGTYVDVGSQIGNHAVFFAKFTQADLVITVEPNPASFKWLIRNIEQNLLNDIIQPINVAAGSKSGSAHLSIPQDGNSGMAHIGEKSDASIEVIVSPLDSLTVASEIGLMKIDVEGFELESLKGAERILRESRPHLFVEAQGVAELEAISYFLIDLEYLLVQRFNATPTFHFVPLEKHLGSHPSDTHLLAQLDKVARVALARRLSDLSNRYQSLEASAKAQRQELESRLIQNSRASKLLLKERVNELNNIIIELKKDLQSSNLRAKELERKYLWANTGLLWQIARRARRLVGYIFRKVRGATNS